MASKITNEQILEMNRQYLKLKTYAATARAVGVSPSTVKKYIVPNFADPAAVEVVRYCGGPIETPIDLFRIDNWGDLCVLSDDEVAALCEIRKEIVI